MASPNLVIIRAGEASKHTNWGTSPNWDLLVSYYGTDPDKYQGNGFERVDLVGGKLESTFKLWHDRPDLFKDREYVWIVDDDVETTAATIDRLFVLMRDESLHLAQPALSLDGYVNHRITAVHEGFRLRYTNMVETMVPCWSIEMLGKVMPYLEDIRYGWGLDHLWRRFAGPRKTAILDCITAKHCRPQGTGEVYDHESDPIVEMRRSMARFRVSHLPTPTVEGAILSNGTYVEGKDLTLALETPKAKVLSAMTKTGLNVPPHTRLLSKHTPLIVSGKR